ncbi:hypothetical protein ABZX90_09820 [Streptomyces sp. NPDC002935]
MQKRVTSEQTDIAGSGVGGPALFRSLEFDAVPRRGLEFRHRVGDEE